MLYEHHRLGDHLGPSSLRSPMRNALDAEYKIIRGLHIMLFHRVATICDQLTLKLFKDQQQKQTEIIKVTVYSSLALLTVLYITN